MTYFIFVGDMLVMAFMVALAIWIFMRLPKEDMDATARIPLEDEQSDG